MAHYRKIQKSITGLRPLISSRNNIIPKFLHPSTSNKQLWSSAAYITCQKHLLNQEILTKQKAVRSLKAMLQTIKNNLNARMNHIDYIHVREIFLVSNEKNISNVKNTTGKKLCNLMLDNIGNVSKTKHDSEKAIFSFSSYRLNNHEKSLLWKGLNFSSFDKRVNSRLRDCAYSSFKQVSKISDKNLPNEEIKA